MKKTFLAALLCSVLLCQNAFAATTRFPDVPSNASYAEAVEAIAEMGIVGGDEKGNFNPNSTLTRAEAATIICRLLGAEAEVKTEAMFSDVPTSHWANKFITAMANRGIIGGYGNGKFGPEDPVTQEQIIKMLVSAWGYADEAQVNGGYPKGYIFTADQLGITKGVSVASTNPASRSLVAQLVYNTTMATYQENIDDSDSVW